jgi:hypothetical protein
VLPRFDAWADIKHYVHTADLRDCYKDRNMSSEADSYPSLAHEAGHAFFGLQDEYCCDTSYTAEANLWISEDTCRAAAATIGYPMADCRKVTKGALSVDFWRVDPDDCKMHDTGGHNFGKACRRAALDRYQRLAAGGALPPPAAEAPAHPEPLVQLAAYTASDGAQKPERAAAAEAATQAPPAPTPAAEVDAFNADAIAQRKAVPMLVLRFRVSDNKLEASHVAIQDVTAAARPDPETSSSRSLIVRAVGAGGVEVGKYRIPDPLWAEAEGGEPIRLKQGETTLRLSLGIDVERLVMEAPGEERTRRRFVIFGAEEPATVTLRDVRGLLRTACERRPDVPECAAALAKK